jgi:uncharacterized protein YecE (DUF72 family)
LLDGCLAQFPKGAQVAVEPRHASWWTGETEQVLQRHGAALCWADRCGRPITPLWRTAGWGYLRLHEGAAKPWPRYGRAALASWVSRIADAWPVGRSTVYVYFNNDPGGAAVYDAVAFAALLAENGRPATRSPLLEPAGGQRS